MNLKILYREKIQTQKIITVNEKNTYEINYDSIYPISIQ
ncbi:MAG: hypothetical protein JETT_2711 [Candidatus Jettenia ecosi]|uniref:Uncharacterized protein n=1 Tax=Candidatus Jettenia ecosi TaxID=2494326 RepID=A0A533Q8M2_9BACT|nr:MAG: hypothetical protein JETT_2711 [Candidatus Jettenia ecosi]